MPRLPEAVHWSVGISAWAQLALNLRRAARRSCDAAPRRAAALCFVRFERSLAVFPGRPRRPSPSRGTGTLLQPRELATPHK